MRTQKPILLYVPQNLVVELDDYLKRNPPKFAYDIVYFHYIIHHIQEIQLKNKNRNKDIENKAVAINIKNLKKVSAANIRDYLNILKLGEFVQTDGKYISGKSSRKYQLNPIYLGTAQIIEINPEKRLHNKILKYLKNSKAHNDRNEPHLRIMERHFMKLDFDYLAAKKWILREKNLTRQTSYLLALSQLQDKRFRYFKRNSRNNRLNSNFTNLKKDLRKFIVGDFVCIDLKNSQPLLLNLLIQSIINNNTHQYPLCYFFNLKIICKTFGNRKIQRIFKTHQIMKNENLVSLSKFENAVIKGRIYEDYMESCEMNIERDEAKKTLLKLMYSSNEKENGQGQKIIPYKNDKIQFEKVYPFVSECIHSLKSKDYRQLSVFLQKVESYVFIDCIAKELVNSGIVPFTIHDSVIVEAKDQEKTEKIIQNIFFEKFHLTPPLRTESLKKANPSLQPTSMEKNNLGFY